MDIGKLFHAIQEGKLFKVVSSQTKNDKVYIKFKRHHSTFTFICSVAENEEDNRYTLLKDKEKARLGTLRAMWSDYQEEFPGGDVNS